MLAVVTVTEVAALILVLARPDTLDRFWESLGRASLFCQWNALACAGLLCLLHRPLERMSHLAAGLTAWLLILLVVAITSQAAHASGAVGPGPFLLRNLAIGGLVGALVLHYLFLRHQWEQRIAAEAEARIQALASRIRPHFLFNSLNTAAALVPVRPDRAEAVLEDLAELFRAGMQDVRRWHRLDDELRLVRLYLAIEALRLGDRLQVVWQQKPVPEACMVPPLILQPLVENAVYHGIEPAAQGGRLHVLVSAHRGRLRLEVRNPRPERDERQRRGNRMALENIRERLRLAFGPLARIETELREAEYRVRILMPIVEEAP